MTINFSNALLSWYDQHGRKDLPWQQNRSAYRVWISEIMLQQTQVKTVIPYFEKFMSSFASPLELANAHEDDVLHHWSGLGYYARARNLHKAARQIRDLHNAEFPLQIEQVLALPGVGLSTAGAILAQAEGQRHAILDGNVKRVLTRFHGVFGHTMKASVQAELWALAERHTPDQRLADYTQAIMDLGATLCTRSKPDCANCPLMTDCVAYNTDQISLLPSAKPKKTIPVKSVRMLLLRNEKQQILLEKRPPTGIWGGLWSLPEMPLDKSVAQWCEEHYQLRIDGITEQPVMRHTFSHYHLDITPCIAEVNNPGNDSDNNPVQSVMEAERIVWYKACHDGDVSQPADRPVSEKTLGLTLGLAAPVSLLLNRLNEELS